MSDSFLCGSKGCSPYPGFPPVCPKANGRFDYQVREAIWRNCATVVVWEFRPPSTVMIWPVT